MDYTLIIILVVFMAFIFFSNRRRKAATQQLENSVKVGSKAVMLGGITGIITEIRETTLVVETLPGTKIEFLKAAVRTVTAPSLDAKPLATKKPPVAKKVAPKPAAAAVKKAVATKPAVKKSTK
ncbi:MAG: preprotein translocase subunit YajC [Rhodoluna sp.]|nr:preprotein translocase subunit YajC [Rhodoluna sp.]